MRFALALALLLTAIGPAEAALGVCNKGARPVKVAVGLFNGTRWASQGWWHVAARQCMQLVPGNLSGRYYYMYASDGASGLWSGSKNFCVAAADKFSIAGLGGCSERGYDRRGFFEIDTGNRLDFTQKLSD
ncbi:MAG TPA: DUF1036 domain-containing protein [Rhizomicrobium sp.]|jgi:uncharacterized membrane protein|nr:DUF1036 domain-containing protein [Rhizomicrobium sp.]